MRGTRGGTVRGANTDQGRDRGEGAPETSLLFEVFALSQAVGRLLAEAMSDGPLTPTEYAVYSAIFELEAASPTQLASRLGMRLTTFMDQFRPIEGRGHARRIDHPGDRRSYLVTLTADGLAAHRAANRRFEEAHGALVAELAGADASAHDTLRAVRIASDAARADLARSTGARPSRRTARPLR